MAGVGLHLSGFASQVGLEEKLMERLSTGYDALASHFNTAMNVWRALEIQSRSLEPRSTRGRQQQCCPVVAGNVSLVA